MCTEPAGIPKDESHSVWFPKTPLGGHSEESPGSKLKCTRLTDRSGQHDGALLSGKTPSAFAGY